MASTGPEVGPGLASSPPPPQHIRPDSHVSELPRQFPHRRVTVSVIKERNVQTLLMFLLVLEKQGFYEFISAKLTIAGKQNQPQGIKNTLRKMAFLNLFFYITIRRYTFVRLAT